MNSTSVEEKIMELKDEEEIFKKRSKFQNEAKHLLSQITSKELTLIF